MIYITDEEIDKFIKDDIPYWDITTELLNIKSSATIAISNRKKECILCGTEEAIRIANKLNLQINFVKPSGNVLKSEETFFEASGDAKDIHKAWRICLNILEYNNCYSYYNIVIFFYIKEYSSNSSLDKSF